MFSIYQFYLESFPKALYITGLWLPVPRKKKYDFEKLKTFRGWVPMNFHGTKLLLLMVSHDLWARNWKNVFHGNWNPRTWVRSTLTEMLFDSVAPLVNITSLGSAPINSATCCKREIMITFKKSFKQKKINTPTISLQGCGWKGLWKKMALINHLVPFTDNLDP